MPSHLRLSFHIFLFVAKNRYQGLIPDIKRAGINKSCNAIEPRRGDRSLGCEGGESRDVSGDVNETINSHSISRPHITNKQQLRTARYIFMLPDTLLHTSSTYLKGC